MKTHRVEYDLDTHQWSQRLPAVDSPSTLVLAFGAPECREDLRPFQFLRKTYPQAQIIGCSSAGEIAGHHIRDRSLSLSISRFSSTKLMTATQNISRIEDSRYVGQQLAKALVKDGLRAVFVLSEGLNVNGSELTKGLSDILPPSVVVTGGLSGDGTRFEQTWVCYGDEVSSNLVVAVGFYGDALRVSHGSQGGWDKFGPPRRVTRSEGNVLYELDGKPALALYKTYLGNKSQELPASALLFPLALKDAADSEKYLVRTILAVDEKAQSMTFAGDIPQGSVVQLMKANFDKLIDGAQGAALTTVDAQDVKGDALAVAISCVGRRLVLGEATEDEVEAVIERLPQGAELVGFYSYGEISPFAKDSPCELHNQTMTITMFHEAVNGASILSKPSAGLIEDSVSDHTVLRPYNFEEQTRMFDAGGLRSVRIAYDLERNTWSDGFPDLDSERTLVLAFGAPEMREAKSVFRMLRKAYPKAQVIGCSSSGEIAGDKVKDRSLSVAVTRFASTDLVSATKQITKIEESRSVGQELARQLRGDGLRAVFVLSEGLNVNGSELTKGLSDILPPSVVVTGGLSGDGTRFEQTWVCYGDEVSSNLVVAVGFYGDALRVSHGSQGGWDKFGPPRRVTRSEGNVLYELDGKPALALYKTYLGNKSQELPASALLFPLALKDAADSEKYLVRTILAVDEKAQSMTFAGDIPQGSVVQLMKANFDKLIDGAQGAALTTVDAQDVKGDALAVAISCVGRRLVLGEATEDEVEAVIERLPQGAELVGFYSYGEISPFAKGSPCELHNQTMTITMFHEAALGSGQRRVPEPAVQAPPLPVIESGSAPSLVASVTSSDSLLLDGFIRDELIDVDIQPLADVEEASALPPRPSSRRRPTIMARSSGAASSQHLHIDKSVRDGVQLVSMRGRMTESFKGSLLGKELNGVVLIDLANVDRVTSYGVREWLHMLSESEARTDQMYLARCSESVTNQLSMIKAFAGNAQVLSFWAPYNCEHCGAMFNALVDCDHDHDEITRGVAPTVECPRCKRDTSELDDDPVSYFSFVGSERQEAPSFIRKQHDALEEVRESEPIEKTLEGDTTWIRLNCDLDAGMRWKRVFDGVEGVVNLDMTNVSSHSPSGVTQLVKALQSVDSDAEMHVLGAPIVLVEALGRAGAMHVLIDSAMVPTRCTACGDSSSMFVDVRDARTLDDVERNLPPCKECGANSLSIGSQGASLAPFLEARHAAPQQEVPPARTELVRDETVAAPLAALPTKQRDARLDYAYGAIALLASILIAVGAVALWKGMDSEPQGEAMKQSNTGANTERVESIDSTRQVAAQTAKIPEVIPVAAHAKLPEEEPKSTPWNTPDELPPAWSEKGLLVGDAQVTLVGHARGAESKEAALQGARASAMSVLIEAVFDQMKGVENYELTRSLIDGAPDFSDQRVLARFNDQNKGEVDLTRAATAMRLDGGAHEAYVQYTLSRESFDHIVAKYSDVVAVRGMRIAWSFPLVDRSSSQSSALVVSASTRAKRAGAARGATVVSVNGDTVYVPGDVQRLNAEYSRRGGAKPLSLVIEHQGKMQAVSFVR